MIPTQNQQKKSLTEMNSHISERIITPEKVIDHWTPEVNDGSLENYLKEIILEFNAKLCRYINLKAMNKYSSFWELPSYMDKLRRIIICDSPLAAQIAANHIKYGVKENNWFAKADSFGCCRKIRSMIHIDLCKKKIDIHQKQFDDAAVEIRNNLYAAVYRQIRSLLFNSKCSGINESIFKNALQTVKSGGFDLLTEERQQTYHHYLWGFQGMHKELFREDLTILKNRSLISKNEFKRFKNVLLFCNYFFDFIDFGEVMIVSRMPEYIAIDEQHRLHNECGCAAKWSDGYELYFWHGVNIPGDYIREPEKITRAIVLAEQNLEKRRVLSEILGAEKFAALLGVVTIDKDIDRNRNPVILYRTAEEDSIINAFLYFASVTCPSTGRKYFLKVPPGNNIWEAVAWTFRRSKDDYNPIIET